MVTTEEIKKWLKKTGISRQQLGEKLLVQKMTVNGWLSSGKPIPHAKMRLIESLMQDNKEAVSASGDLEEYLSSRTEELKSEIQQSIDKFTTDVLKRASMADDGE